MFCAVNALVVGWWIVISSKVANKSGTGFVHQFSLMFKESLDFLLVCLCVRERWASVIWISMDTRRQRRHEEPALANDG